MAPNPTSSLELTGTFVKYKIKLYGVASLTSMVKAVWKCFCTLFHLILTLLSGGRLYTETIAQKDLAACLRSHVTDLRSSPKPVWLQ
jgi:hypothetical protein